jgi:hypothetical protein
MVHYPLRRSRGSSERRRLRETGRKACRTLKNKEEVMPWWGWVLVCMLSAGVGALITYILVLAHIAKGFRW